MAHGDKISVGHAGFDFLRRYIESSRPGKAKWRSQAGPVANSQFAVFSRCRSSPAIHPLQMCVVVFPLNS
jgi:hypothetical protein